MTNKTDRSSWILLVAVLVLLGTGMGVTLGWLSPFAAGLLIGAGVVVAVLSAGRLYSRQ